MLKRIKQNKGYYGYLFADQTQAAVLSFLTFSLLNPVAAGVMAALNLAVNAFNGVHKGPKASAAPPTGEREGFVRAIRNFIKSTVGNPRFVVSTASAGAGSILMFQSVAGLQAALLLSGIPAVLGVAACGGVMAVAAACMIWGASGKWRGLSRFYMSTFRKDIAEEDYPKEINLPPRLQKIFDKGPAKKAKSGLMAGAAANSAIFSITAACGLLAQRLVSMAAAPHTIPAKIPGTFLALKLLAVPAWDLTCSVRVLKKDFGAKRKAAQEKDACAPEATAFRKAFSVGPVKGKFDDAASGRLGVARAENCAESAAKISASAAAPR
jgi:hypothetical protein